MQGREGVNPSPLVGIIGISVLQLLNELDV